MCELELTSLWFISGPEGDALPHVRKQLVQSLEPDRTLIITDGHTQAAKTVT
ncbi:MAG: hypothetical protein P8M13_00730 [Luminiphilus sp.]|nr:hypothetical protein [Luminiphilus sp.]